MGQREAARGVVRREGAQNRLHAPRFHVPLSVGRALDRDLPYVLRTDAQGVRRAAAAAPGRAARRADRASVEAQPRARRRLARDPGRVPGGRDHEGVTKRVRDDLSPSPR